MEDNFIESYNQAVTSNLCDRLIKVYKKLDEAGLTYQGMISDPTVNNMDTSRKDSMDLNLSQ